MGFKLSPLLKTSVVKCSRESFANKTIAIDAFNELYKFIGFSSRRPIGDLMLAFLQRILNVLKLGCTPIYALEVDNLSNKNDRVDKTVDVAIVKNFIDRAVDLVTLMGLPRARAPRDGESQAAYIVNRGDAFAVASEDYDTLLFGAKRMVIKLVGVGQPVMISLDDVLRELRVTHDQLIDASIIAGNDYCKGIKGVGVKTALDMVRKYGSIEGICDLRIVVCGTIVSLDMIEVDRVREIFKNPSTESIYELNRTKPRYAEIRSLMVNDLECDPTEVDRALADLKRINIGKQQIGMDSFFN